MGQYYMPISLDSKEYVYSHDYKSGLKLMEHSWILNEFVGVIEKLLSPGGKWYNTRIVWAGDYADHEGVKESAEIHRLIVKNRLLENDNEGKYTKGTINGFLQLESDIESGIHDYGNENGTCNLYAMTDLEFKKRKPKARNITDKILAETRYVVNHDKKEYVDKTRIPICGDGWIIHPLPLLTCEGNGLGGGDYHDNGQGEGIIGRWARDHITIENVKPGKGYEMIDFDLTE